MLKFDESKKISNFKILSYAPAKNIEEVYRVKKNDNILIWCDLGFRGKYASPRMGKTFYKYFKKIGCNVSIIVGKAKLKPHFANKKINSAFMSLSKNDLFISLGSGQAIYFYKNKKRLITRELMNAQGFKMVATNGLGSLKESQIENFFQAYNHNKEEVKMLGNELKKLFKKTKKVSVTCPKGTCLSLVFEKRRVINNYGDSKNDTNYPVGETYTSPLEGKAEGIAFVKSSKVLGETYLHKKPVKYIFEKGILTRTKFKKLNDALDELEKFNEKNGITNAHDKVRNLAEFAIGTNKKAKLIGIMINDEKVYGTCHIGIGASKHFGGKVFCNGHSDHVIENPTIYFDGKKILENGNFLI